MASVAAFLSILLVSTSASAQVYQAAADFALVQGPYWFYRDSSGALLTVNTSLQRWQGSEPFLYLWADGGHPGATRDAVRRWVAPAGGTTRITGSARDQNSGGGDGVAVYIRHGAATIWQATIANGDTTGVAFDITIGVQAGDTLDFGINPRANNGHDSTYFNPTIVLTPLGSDTTPPGLSNVSVANLTSTGATVSWGSDEGSSSQVEYGLTASYGQTTVLDPTLVTTHTVLLSGLLPGTEYHYRVVSVDAAGNVGASADGTFTTVTAPEGSTIYQAAADFALVQGPYWFYRDSSGALLTVNTSLQRWQGSEPFLYLWADGGHPGATRDAVRRWVAPAGGTTRITGSARDQNSGGGDGVAVYIRHGAATIWQATIANGDTTGVAFDITIGVQAGDTLDFGINPRANNGHDSTYFNPTIVLTPLGSDTTPPGLSNVSVANLTSTGATVSWGSDEGSSSQVEYGLTASYGQTTVLDPTLVTTHTVLLSGLLPGTEYHYRVVSVDAAGNVGASADGTFTTVTAPEGSTIYQAAADFALVQGPYWFYRDSSGALLTVNTSLQRWQGSEPFLYLWADGGHPGATRDAVRRWVAPAGGTTRITGSARDQNSGGGDGVAVYIRHGAATIWQATIANGDTTGVAFDITIGVQAGDTLDFGINPRANNGHDSTYFNPTIVLTPLGSDTTPPGLSNVSVANLTSTGATVSWGSDEGSSSQVEYGLTASYGQTTVLDPTLVTTHTVLLSGLLPGTEYHYRVVSVDAAGNVGASADGTFTTVTAPEGSTIYQAAADFALVQGPYWFYRDSSGALLTVNTSLQRWQGSEPFLYLWADGGHPGATRDAVRRWVAPAGGTTRITGSARDQNSGGGDGVAVYIRHGAATIWQATIANGDTTGVAFDITIGVQAGDTLDFGINPRANNGHDSTYFNPTITLAGAEFVSELVAELPDFTPVGLTFAPDGRILIWQRTGFVRIVQNGVLLPTPFVDISGSVNYAGDRGFLGLALDPAFSTNGFVYLLYTYEHAGNPTDGGARTARLTRVTADPANPNRALPESEVVILGTIGIPPCSAQPVGSDCIPSDSNSHTIGTVTFARDGTLFVGNGDGSSFSFPDVNALRAQDLNSYSGKILRINPDGTAPADNPFYNGNPNAIRSKVWAYGLRNPFRFTLDPAGTDVYVGDVGWDHWEEINRGRGANFGWPCYEGNSTGSAPQPQYQAAFAQCQSLAVGTVTPPLYAYDHALGSTVIAGTVYTGTAYPERYRGNLFLADYTGEWIRRIVFAPDGSVARVELFASGLGPGFGGPVHLQMGPDGLLYYIVFTLGEVRRFRYGGSLAVASADPTFGYSPLTVQFSGSDSSGPGGSALTYFWEFGDGSTSTAADPVHQYDSSVVRTFTARLRVTDSTGGNDSTTMAITVGSTAPQPSIDVTPADGTPVAPGQVINFEGSVTDADEALPDSALRWTVLLHHNTHVHAVQETTGQLGSVTVEDHGTGTFSYEIVLSVTDSSGLTASTSVSFPVGP